MKRFVCASPLGGSWCDLKQCRSLCSVINLYKCKGEKRKIVKCLTSFLNFDVTDILSFREKVKLAKCVF